LGPPPPSPTAERDAGPSTFEGDPGAGPSVPKRGRGRPPGSKNKNKVNPEAAAPAPDARRKGKASVRRVIKTHAADKTHATDWSHDIIMNNIHKFKGLGDLRPEQARLGNRSPFSNRSSTSTIKYRRRRCKAYSRRPTSIGLLKLCDHRHPLRGSLRVSSGRLRGQHG